MKRDEIFSDPQTVTLPIIGRTYLLGGTYVAHTIYTSKGVILRVSEAAIKDGAVWVARREAHEETGAL